MTHSLTSGSQASVICPLVCHFRVSLLQRNPCQCWVRGVFGQRVRLVTYPSAMRNVRPLLALCSLVLAFAPDAGAAPGDVYVPAHKTRDGHYVPPNVPPASAGTRVARRPSRGTAAPRHTNAKLAPPLLVEAREVRR